MKVMGLAQIKGSYQINHKDLLKNVLIDNIIVGSEYGSKIVQIS